jgi:hypothetical protein
MLTDGLTTRESEGTAGNTTEVLDVAQLLLAGVKRGGKPEPAAPPAAESAKSEPAKSEPGKSEPAEAESAGPESATKQDDAAQE